MDRIVNDSFFLRVNGHLGVHPKHIKADDVIVTKDGEILRAQYDAIHDSGNTVVWVCP